MAVSGYWEERAVRRVRTGERETASAIRLLREVYDYTTRHIRTQIAAFLALYGEDDSIDLTVLRKLLTRSELKELKADIDNYLSIARQIENREASKRYVEELEKMEKRQNVSHMEALHIALLYYVMELGIGEENIMRDSLSNGFTETYQRDNYDIQQYMGEWRKVTSVGDRRMDTILNQSWAGDNYSNRIWRDKQKLLNELETTFTRGVAMDRSVDEIASDIARNTGVSFRNAQRLVRTEMARVQGEATKETYREYKITKYQFVATLDDRTSEMCFVGTDKVQSTSDVLNLFKRSYTGEIITITTASGKQITGTPNHPILTSSGWLTLNEINPSEHIVYSVLDESVGVVSKKNINVPTELSKLFDSFAKMSAIDVAVSGSSATKFDSDTFVNEGKVHILSTKGVLRNWRKAVCGKHIVKDSFSLIHNRIKLLCMRMLKSLGLRGTETVKTPEAKIISFSNFIKPRFATSEFANDNKRSNAIVKHLNRFLFVLKNHRVMLSSFKNRHNFVLLEKICDCRNTDRILFCQFASGYAVPVLADNVVSKRSEFVSNHPVYNLHTKDNTYVNNGIIVHNCQEMDLRTFDLKDAEVGVNWPPLHSNCRSTTVPYIENADEDSTRAARNQYGRSINVPASMSYKEWKAKYLD